MKSETKIDEIDKKLDKIMINDLPHIYKKLAVLNWQVGAILTILSAVGYGVLKLVLSQ